MNREKLLEDFLNEGCGKNYDQMLVRQVMRESEDVEHLAVIRAFRKDLTGNAVGATVCCPCCEIKNLGTSETENYEELIASKGLAHDVAASDDDSNFKPLIPNGSNEIGKERRESAEVVNCPHCCKCRVKAKVGTAKKVSASKGRKF